VEIFAGATCHLTPMQSGNSYIDRNPSKTSKRVIFAR
jgi:hypothetical protein